MNPPDLLASVWGPALGALQTAPTGVEAGGGFDPNSLLRGFLRLLILLANTAGGLVVGVATVRCLGLFVVGVVQRHGGETPKEAIRLSLGRSLALALEFQLGADILGTALDPSLSDIALLGAIVILRTVLNFFLGRELAEAERRERSESVRPPMAETPAPASADPLRARG